MPQTIHQVTFSREDFNGRTQEELINLGKAMPFVTKIYVTNATAELVKLLEKHIGHGLVNTYATLLAMPRLPHDLVPKILSYVTNHEPSSIHRFFVANRHLKQTLHQDLPSCQCALM